MFITVSAKWQQAQERCTGALQPQGVNAVFNMPISELPRKNSEWLESNFFECELTDSVLGLVFQHRRTGERFILDEFFNNAMEATAWYKRLENKKRNEDTDTWVPS